MLEQSRFLGEVGTVSQPLAAMQNDMRPSNKREVLSALLASPDPVIIGHRDPVQSFGGWAVIKLTQKTPWTPDGDGHGERFPQSFVSYDSLDQAFKGLNALFRRHGLSVRVASRFPFRGGRNTQAPLTLKLVSTGAAKLGQGLG